MEAPRPCSGAPPGTPGRGAAPRLGAGEGPRAAWVPRSPVGGVPRRERPRAGPGEWHERLGFDEASWSKAAASAAGLGPAHEAADCGCGCSNTGIASWLGREDIGASPVEAPSRRVLGAPLRAAGAGWWTGSVRGEWVAPGATGPDHAAFGRSNFAAALLAELGAVSGPLAAGPPAMLLGAFQTTPSGFGNGSTTTIASEATGCWWLVAEKHWCHDATDEDTGDISLEAADVELINDAYDKLNKYLGYVYDYFRYHASAWDQQLSGCMFSRMMGQGTAGPMWIAEATLRDAEAASTVPWTGFLTIDWEYLRQTIAYREDESNDASVGDWHCPTAEVAGLLIHEMLHSCGALWDPIIHLVSAYFRYRYARYWGFSDRMCCQQERLSSWDQSENSCADARSEVWRALADGVGVYCEQPDNCA